MYLPCRPLSSNLTTPSMSANSVSSLPRPTFLPGFHFVPRCRARMLPPSTRSPPNFLSPSLCAFESRPFRDEPTPFLCAIVLTPSAEVRVQSDELIPHSARCIHHLIFTRSSQS